MPHSRRLIWFALASFVAATFVACRLPGPDPGSTVWLCPADEPGERLVVHGRVLDEHGAPLPGASVIAYATDASGRYVPAGTARAHRLPRLRGVAVTDGSGAFRFVTVMPGGYPGTDDPAHVHLHVDAPVHQHTYRTLCFEGDPRLTQAKRVALDAETVIVPRERGADGAWVCRLDVPLAGS